MNPNADADLESDESEIHLEPGSQLARIVELCLGEKPGATMRWGTLRALVEGRAFRVKVETVEGPDGGLHSEVDILGLLP